MQPSIKRKNMLSSHCHLSDMDPLACIGDALKVVPLCTTSSLGLIQGAAWRLLTFDSAARGSGRVGGSGRGWWQLPWWEFMNGHIDELTVGLNRLGTWNVEPLKNPWNVWKATSLNHFLFIFICFCALSLGFSCVWGAMGIFAQSSPKCETKSGTGSDCCVSVSKPIKDEALMSNFHARLHNGKAKVILDTTKSGL